MVNGWLRDDAKQSDCALVDVLLSLFGQFPPAISFAPKLELKPVLSRDSVLLLILDDVANALNFSFSSQ